MYLLVRLAQDLSDDEKVEQGLVGIPLLWPIETTQYDGGEVPVGWTVMTDSEILQAKHDNQAAYTAWLVVMKTPAPQDVVKSRILAAMEFARNLIAEYGATNVVLGFTTAQILDVSDRLSKVQQLLLSGSLYAALNEIDNVQTDDTLITPDRVLVFKNKIRSYVGLPPL